MSQHIKITVLVGAEEASHGNNDAQFCCESNEALQIKSNCLKHVVQPTASTKVDTFFHTCEINQPLQGELWHHLKSFVDIKRKPDKWATQNLQR